MPYQPIGKYEGSRGFARKTDFKRPVTFYDRVRFVGDDSTMEIFGGVLSGDLNADNITLGSLHADRIATTTLDADNLTTGTLVAARIDAGSLDGDKITAGTLTADEIKAGTITTSRLVIGSFDNLISNPGFESGVSTPHYLDEAPGSEWIVRQAAADGFDPRSGNWQVEVRHDTLSATAFLHLNGWLGSIVGHFEVHEGDVIYAECYARGQGTDATTGRMNLQWIDADGNGVGGVNGASATITIHASNWKKFYVEGTAPADAVYPVIRMRVDSSNQGTSYVALDDFYARRKIGSLIIEDQAVDIERMLDPVFVDGQGAIYTGKIMDSTIRDYGTITVTIPSWVGSVSIVATTTVQHTGVTADSLVTGNIKIAGSVLNGRSSSIEYNSVAITHGATTSVAKTIASPGATVAVITQAQDTQFTSTNKGSAVTSALSVGVR